MEEGFGKGDDCMIWRPIFGGCEVSAAHRYQNADYRLTSDWKTSVLAARNMKVTDGDAVTIGPWRTGLFK